MRARRKTVPVDGKSRRRFSIGSTRHDTLRFPRRGSLLQSQLVLVEGVHFDLAICTAAELGHRAISMALSDLAACGGVPRHLQITLGVPQEFSELFLLEFESGFTRLRRRLGFSVAVSPTVLSPNGLILSIASVGEVPRRSALARGPSKGDIVAVTGALGGSIAALRCLRAYGRHDLRQELDLIQPHLLPTPRVEECQALFATGAVTACVEIADGFAAELNTLCTDQGVGALIEEASLPVHSQALVAASRLSTPDAVTSWVLYGAEDFEILVSLDPKQFQKASRALSKLGTPLTAVGRITDKKGQVEILRPNGTTAILENKQWHPLVRRRKA